MFQVFHSNRMLQYFFDPSTLNGATMTHVASVETDSLEEAFQLTNHIDSDWTKNPRVKAREGAHRSTSVGDLIVDGTPLSRGSKHYVVEAAGCRELTWEEVCSLTICLPTH